MRVNLQFESKSPFLPELSLPLNITTFNRFKELEILVLEKEQEILDNNDPVPPTDSRDWLTNRLFSYNLFDYVEEYPVLIEFKKFIYESYVEYCNSIGAPVETVYANCWANVIRNNGRTISAHEHSGAHIKAPHNYAYVSGNICVNAMNTNTYYSNPYLPKQAIPIKNIPGELVLFPSWVTHWVDQNLSDTPRISIAFDIVTEYVYKLKKELATNFRKL